LEANIPWIHPAPLAIVLITVGTWRQGLAGRVEGVAVPWARVHLGWLSPPLPSPGCLSAGLASAWVGGLA
jgi:hypothetical protein